VIPEILHFHILAKNSIIILIFPFLLFAAGGGRVVYDRKVRYAGHEADVVAPCEVCDPPLQRLVCMQST
jgi:hypothetical protein